MAEIPGPEEHNINIPHVNSLGQFMDFVETLNPGFCLSRGQSQDYPLLPSALRKDERGARKYSRQTAAHFLDEFKINSYNYMPNPWDIRNDFEWMIYAQHYGLPTRLLDFTYSHIFALLFAVESAFSEPISQDAVVWFLDPSNLNNRSARRTEIITISELAPNLDNFDGPVVIQGRRLNIRVNAQNGVFIYFQDTEVSLENSVQDNEILRKIIIESEYKKHILASLYTMGIGFTQIYPELTSVPKDILQRNNIRDYYILEEVQDD